MQYSFSDKIKTLKPSAIREIFKYLSDPTVISFAGGNPAPESFPSVAFSKISTVVFENRAAEALQYSTTEGYLPLRKRIEDRMKTKFNIMQEFDDIIITSGGQQGIDLTAKVLLNEGDSVICEEPSFIGALNAFRAYNAKLVGVPVEDDGINIEKLEVALKTTLNVKIIYVIPNFQNPTGITMSLEKRKMVYALAKKYGVMVLEDNPYGELRFKGESIASIKSLDTEGLVVYTGSFSKILSAGMRVGFLIGPCEVVSKVIVAKQVNDVHTNIFFQILVEEYIKNYDLENHIQGIRKLYSEKSAKMLDCLDNYFKDKISYTRPEGGLFIWCTMKEGMDMNAFVKKAIESKVAVVTGNAFLCDENAPSTSFRLNFSLPSIEQIEKGISVLADVYKDFSK